MVERTECEVCGLPHDFDREASGWCMTCEKKWMCYPCCYNHVCIEGKKRQLRIITNPQWIANLLKERSKDE